MRVFASLMMTLFFVSAQAQNKTAFVSGNVVDENGTGITKASVIILGKTFVARRAALDRAREAGAGLANHVVGRDALVDEELLVGPGLDRRLRRKDKSRRVGPLGKFPADEAGAEADDLDGFRPPPPRVSRFAVDDRKRIAGDQDQVGPVARLHGREGAVEHADLVSLELHVVIAERDLRFGVYEDDPRRAHDAARGQPRREVGSDREPSKAGVRHDDRDVRLLPRDVGECAGLPGAGVEGNEENGREDQNRGGYSARTLHHVVTAPSLLP